MLRWSAIACRVKGDLCAKVIRLGDSYNQTDETQSKLALVPEQSGFTNSG